MVNTVIAVRLALVKKLPNKVRVVLVVVPEFAAIRETIMEESVLAGPVTEHLGNHPNMERRAVVELNRGREVKLVVRILEIMEARVLGLLADSVEVEEDLKITALLELAEDILEVAVENIQTVQEVEVDHIVQELVVQAAQEGIRQVNMDL